MNILKLIYFILFAIILLNPLSAEIWRLSNTEFIQITKENRSVKLLYKHINQNFEITNKILPTKDKGAMVCFLKSDRPSIDILKNLTIVEARILPNKSLLLTNGESKEEIIKLLPVQYIDGHYFDEFMLKSTKNKDYLTSLDIKLNEVCLDYDCLENNFKTVEYLSLRDTLANGGFNYKLNDKVLSKIAKARNLKKIFIEGIQLKSIPENWKNLTKLEELVIWNAGLEKVNLDLSRLSNLEVINLNNNWLKKVKLGGSGIIDFSAENNYITDVNFTSDLVNLKKLSLAKNKLSDFAPYSVTIESLVYLNLAFNEFSNFTLSPLKNLHSFFIHGNNCKEFEFENLSRFENLGLYSLLNVNKDQIKQLKSLYLDEYSDYFEAISLPYLNIFGCSSISLGNQNLGLDLDKTLLPELNAVQFFDFDYLAIYEFWRTYSPYHIYYEDDSGNSNYLPPLNSNERKVITEMEKNGTIPELIAFNYFNSKKQSNLAFYIGLDIEQTKTSKLSYKKMFLLEVRMANLMDNFDDSGYFTINYDNIFQHPALERHKKIVSLSSQWLSKEDKNKYKNQINYSKSICYLLFATMKNQFIDDNNYRGLISQNVKTSRKSIELAESAINSLQGVQLMENEFRTAKAKRESQADYYDSTSGYGSGVGSLRPGETHSRKGYNSNDYRQIKQTGTDEYGLPVYDYAAPEQDIAGAIEAGVVLVGYLTTGIQELRAAHKRRKAKKIQKVLTEISDQIELYNIELRKYEIN